MPFIRCAIAALWDTKAGMDSSLGSKGFIMAAFDNVYKLVKDWQLQACPTELQYRKALTIFLRQRMPKGTTVDPEYRHKGTTTDIYVTQPGFFESSEVFIELKRNLLQKAQYDRLVGQIEELEPGKSAILVILCGETNPSMVTRLKEKYEITNGLIISGEPMAVVVKRF